ncbi:MAG: 4Fe-4S binding protein [Paludibacteraceae bacterium]|nr:4Fe-4S binding protein [Paludibacteraceae bacterium]
MALPIIASFPELAEMQKKCAADFALRELSNRPEGVTAEEIKNLHNDGFEQYVLVCGGTGCHASNSAEILKNFEVAIEKHGLNKKVKIVRTGCFGFCEQGPIVKILPDNTFYVHVTPEDVEEIVASHLESGNKVERLLYVLPTTGEHMPDSKHMPFYKKQVRIALRNCGFIDPENINDYFARRGYEALAKVLQMKPEDVIQTIIEAGLRGRGGGGFPTGQKWKITREVQNDTKYVVCNADEGDPGAFMDRSILEGDPFSIIEAMSINGYCTGANHGLIYIRAEYPLAIHRLEIAIAQARECHLLGNNILGTNFSFDIELRYGAGAFVCGEETALIRSMEGHRGEPYVKPPFPSVRGYKGYPTNVNNVETFANIPPIILNGAKWFASIGTEKSHGTKVFALAGKVNNVGLIEVPMGTTLRQVIFEIGGGIKGGKKFKAVQTGGPSGGCLCEKHLDIPIDYDNLIAAGSMMGSGGMIVMDEDNCMVAVAKFYLDFTVEESCGKCAPCRIGNKRLYELLDKITKGCATMEDLENLENLAKVIKDTALCGLGQTSPNPVLSTLLNFRDEYIAHVVDHRCPAHQCTSLVRYSIDPAKCKGCTACARNCPVNAISGTVKNPHTIDPAVCIRCGSCVSRCKFGAITVE